jgi:uncharacterized protein DUF4232
MIAPPKSPSAEELEALIREARARQLRRRLLGAATVAVVAAIGLAIYALAIGGGDGGAELAGGSAIPGPPLCRASQLATTVGMNGATGTMAGLATLTNASTTPCSLPRTRPRVSIFWRGKELPARQKEMSGDGSAPVRVLAPGARAVVHMDWSNWCGKPSTGTEFTPTVQLRFAGVRLAARAQAMTPPRCGGPGGSTIYVSRLLAD